MDYQAALQSLRERTGIVIPVYFPKTATNDVARELLGETVGAFAHELADPCRICLSVDGTIIGANVAARIASEVGVQLVVSDQNRGKYHAVRQGMLRLLEDRALDYLAVVDQDGDHFANELLNFVRAARYVEHEARESRILVLGRRISRHRPMGFLRGELEELADRILLDALAWHAARVDQPLRLEFSTTLDEFPDFHSGYKLFTRPLAEAIFRTEPDLAGLPEEAAYRHAVEAVLCTESILARGLLASVNRSTYDEQPISAFGQLNRSRMVADKILWPCRRLRVPWAFVEQWMANHLPRLQLGTLTPAGVEELTEIRQLVRAGFGHENKAGPAGSADPDRILRPRFI